MHRLQAHPSFPAVRRESLRLSPATRLRHTPSQSHRWTFGSCRALRRSPGGHLHRDKQIAVAETAPGPVAFPVLVPAAVHWYANAVNGEWEKALHGLYRPGGLDMRPRTDRIFFINIAVMLTACDHTRTQMIARR